MSSDISSVAPPTSQCPLTKPAKPIPISLQKRISKTKICIYNINGRCTRGVDCSFAHSKFELKQAPDLYKTRLCSRFITMGFCPLEDNCRFAHGDSELRSIIDIFKINLCSSGLRQNSLRLRSALILRPTPFAPRVTNAVGHMEPTKFDHEPSVVMKAWRERFACWSRRSRAFAAANSPVSRLHPRRPHLSI